MNLVISLDSKAFDLLLFQDPVIKFLRRIRSGASFYLAAQRVGETRKGDTEGVINEGYV